MPTLLFSNNARSKLAAPINAAATSCFLTAGTGSLFPSPGANEGFYLTFNDAGTGLLTEVVLVTLIAGDEILIMERAQQGTPAQNWTAGSFASQFYTSGDADSFAQTGAGGVFLQSPVPVSQLGAPVSGARYFVNNSTVSGVGHFGSIVVGGGAYSVPVWSDGIHWYIG